MLPGRSRGRIVTPVDNPDLLAAKRLWFRYRREPWLIEDVSLTVPAGGLLRIRGGNGSGKSSLLRLLAGSISARRGTIFRAGPVAYLPQQTSDLPAIKTGRLVRLIAGDCDPEIQSQIAQARADELSRGWQRRVLLAAVMQLSCSIVILDEPTAGLDAGAVRRLTEQLSARLATGHVVVLAEHEPLPLPAGEVLDLGGTSHPLSVEATTDSAFHSGQVKITLGGTGSFRGRTASDSRLTFVVAATERDELILAALQDGWSVLTVAAPR